MTSDANVEAQFRETMRENSRLAQELGAAKHEITLLRSRLRELEVYTVITSVSAWNEVLTLML